MTTIIHLDSSDCENKTSIEKIIDRKIDYDCNFAELEYEIIAGEHTWIDSQDERRGTEIMNIIANERIA